MTKAVLNFPEQKHSCRVTLGLFGFVLCSLRFYLHGKRKKLRWAEMTRCLCRNIINLQQRIITDPLWSGGCCWCLTSVLSLLLMPYYDNFVFFFSNSVLRQIWVSTLMPISNRGSWLQSWRTKTGTICHLNITETLEKKILFYWLAGLTLVWTGSISIKYN